MKGVFSFILAFCVGSLALGALHILLPEGALKKPVKYALGVCFVCLVVSFFPLSLNIDFENGLDTMEAAGEKANTEAARITVKTALDSANITYSDIRIIPSYNLSGEIVSITVEVYTNEDKETVKKLLESENIKVSVINE